MKYGEENSRIDLLLEDDHRPDCYIEVKSVTLLDEREQPGMGYFPDAVTTRGAKHLRELMAMKAAGHRAVLLFMVLHSGIARMRLQPISIRTIVSLLNRRWRQGLKFYAIAPMLGCRAWWLRILSHLNLTICYPRAENECRSG